MRAESGAVDATSDIPDDDYTVPLDKAAVLREGSDVTILGWLLMLHFSMQAAEQLAAEGIGAEVIDVRSLSPIDYDTIGAFGAEDRPRRHRRGRPAKRVGERGNCRRHHGAFRRIPALSHSPRGIGRRAGPVHARARERLSPRCSTDRPAAADLMQF